MVFRTSKTSFISKFRGEVFVEMVFEHSHLLRKQYYISNFGRIVSRSPNQTDFILIKPSVIQGFNYFKYRMTVNGQVKNKSIAIYKLVGEHFLEKTSMFNEYLIHLDYNSSNDHYTNLKWVSYDEKIQHYNSSPKVIAGRDKSIKTKKTKDGHKLRLNDVIRIRKALNSTRKTYTLRELAKKYKVSDMQIHRIKTGENWKHIDELFNI